MLAELALAVGVLGLGGAAVAVGMRACAVLFELDAECLNTKSKNTIEAMSTIIYNFAFEF